MAIAACLWGSALAWRGLAPRSLPARPALLRCAAPVLLEGDDALAGTLAAAADGAAAAASVAAEAAAAIEPEVVSDTLLDIGVYTVLAAAVVLTVYSIFVTLQGANEQYGGWTKKDGEEDYMQEPEVSSDRLRPGAVYDPATDQWSYPKKEAAPARVGRAPAAAKSDEDGNRYDRRMEKKRKKMQARKKK